LVPLVPAQKRRAAPPGDRAGLRRRLSGDGRGYQARSKLAGPNHLRTYASDKNFISGVAGG
jgi:hypothetical protein